MRLAAIIVLAGLPLTTAAGGVRTVSGEMIPARAGAPTVATATSARSQYVLHCAGCHGRDGAGDPASYVPDLRRVGDFLRVPGGREFVIKVPGVMASGLDDAQVVAVANWLLANLARASRPEDAPAYDIEEVRRARATPLIDVAAARRALVERARAQGVAIE